MQIISADQIKSVLDWDGVLNAMCKAHLGPRPQGDSYFIGDANYGLFSRGVILPGSGAGLKLASIFPANSYIVPRLPSEQAVFVVIDETTKAISAVLDGPEITRWKTAADSVLAAKKLSKEDSGVLLVIGAGPVAATLVDAYLHIRPSIQTVLLWNRTPKKLMDICSRLLDKGICTIIVDDLNAAIAKADIVVSATSAATPLIRRQFVRTGTHIDLVGSFRPDMQEAESEVLQDARIFVDDRISAGVAGDICIPLAASVIRSEQIEGDLFDLCQMQTFDRVVNQTTVYKNAGGAHLDLIVSQYVIKCLKC